MFIQSSKTTKTKFANPKLVGSIPTVLHRRVYKCVDCGHYQIEANPLSYRKLKKLSDHLILEILTDLKNIKVSYKDVALKYNISPTEIQNIFDDHVNLRSGVLPEILSIDEKLFIRPYTCLYHILKTT